MLWLKLNKSNKMYKKIGSCRRAVINCISNLCGFVWLESWKVHDILLKMQKETTDVSFSYFVLFILSRYYFKRNIKINYLVTCKNIHWVRVRYGVLCMWYAWIFTFIFNSFCMKLHVHWTPYLMRWWMALSHIHQGNTILCGLVGRWKNASFFSNLSKY